MIIGTDFKALVAIAFVLVFGCDSSNSEQVSVGTGLKSTDARDPGTFVANLLDAAKARNVGALLAHSSSYSSELAAIQQSNPRSLWPQLMDQATKGFQSQLQAGKGPNGLYRLIEWSAYQHQIADIETRLEPGKNRTFVTFHYPDARTAPLKERLASVIRQRIAEITWDPRSQKVIQVQEVWAGEQLYSESEIPFRVTSVVWTYDRTWQLGVNFIGAPWPNWPVELDLNCGALGSFHQVFPGRSHIGASPSETLAPMASFASNSRSGTCSLHIRNSAGKEDRVEFDVSTPVPEYKCWIRPVYVSQVVVAAGMNDRCKNLEFLRGGKEYNGVIEISHMPFNVEALQNSATVTTTASSPATSIALSSAAKEGYALYAAGEYAKAAEKLSVAAANGDAKAAGYLGWMYKSGTGVTRDLPKSIELFKQSADAGEPGAAFNLGDIYLEGQGVKRDAKAAKQWYSKALAGYMEQGSGGDAEAMAMVGKMYASGIGTTVNYVAALEWLKRASALGNPKGTRTLGEMYLYGQGVRRDDAEGLRLLRIAAQKSDPIAQQILQSRGEAWN